MKHYFVFSYFDWSLVQHNYIGTDEAKALLSFEEGNAEMPFELCRYDEETQMVELMKFKMEFGKLVSYWAPCYKAWITVRKEHITECRETVICDDAIFCTMEEVTKYICKNGGNWKVYSFKELRAKFIEEHQVNEWLSNQKR